MKDEIKEILKEIESYENEEICLIILSQEQNKALLDYITNLQQENDGLKNSLENEVADNNLRLEEIKKLKKELKLAEENEEYWHNAFSDLEDEYVRLHDKIVKTIEILLSEDGNIPDYKLIEKAIDIIKGEDND